MRKFANSALSKFDKIDRLLHKESVYAFTTDIDWAPEWAIKDILDLFKRLGIPLTPFITHKSAAVESEYRNKPEHIGLHPNFLPDSSHGNKWTEQIDFVRGLWPRSDFYRSHAFFDNSHISWRFRELGFRYDSNVGLFLQPYLTPLLHLSGLVRFPVFWEDDVHGRTFPMLLRHVRKFVDKPGLKIFNFHPMWVGINAPNLQYYQEHKFLYNSKEISNEELEKSKFKGKGTRSFLLELAKYVQSSGVSPLFMRDIFEDFFES